MSFRYIISVFRYIYKIYINISTDTEAEQYFYL